MKKVIHCCLAHPCWSGISGIIALATLFTGIKLSDEPTVTATLVSVVPPDRTETNGTTPPTQKPNLSGNWTIESRLTNSEYKAFEGLSLRYHVGIVQTDDFITVNGEKVSEQKGKSPLVSYKGAARTKFKGEGHIKSLQGNQTIQLDIIEGSTTRGEIKSRCNLRVVDQDHMEGEFSTEAANAIGLCSWRRVKPKQDVAVTP